MGKFDYELIVVGAGPAGSSAAYGAARNGIKVALIEKEESVAQTVRTSGVTWIDNIKEFNIPENCFHPIKNFTFCSPNNEVSISDKVARAAVLDVRSTYRLLADRAKQEGVELFLNHTVTGVIKKDGKIAGVKTKSKGVEHEFLSKMIIDAGGFQSTVSREMGVVKQWKRFGVGAEYEVDVEHVDSDTWWLMVGQKYSPAGYAWIFPVSKNRVRIGVGVGKPESDIDPTLRLKEIIENKMGPVEKLGKLSNEEFHYGLIPNEGLIRDTVFDNLILVGDSAGMANPLVLEGIRYAIKYGKLAGKVSAKAIQESDTGKRRLQVFETTWKKEIESKINSAYKVQSRWIGLSDKEWDKEISIISDLSADEFLDFVKADFGISKMFRLATHHPKLIVRQLFGMVKST